MDISILIDDIIEEKFITQEIQGVIQMVFGNFQLNYRYKFLTFFIQ